MQLLRKRLEPGVEEWVELGRGIGEGLREGKGGGMRVEEWRELWDWGPVRANQEARGYEWFVGDVLREEEGEGGMDVDGDGDVGGGDDGEEEDGEGDGEGEVKVEGEEKEKEGVVGKAVKMEDVLRFMSTGARPR